MSKFCGNCGAELTDDAKVCGQCGTPVERVSANIPTPKIVDPEKQKKTKKRIKLLGGLVVLAVVAVIAFNIVSKYTGFNGALRKVMKAYEGYDIETLVSMSSDVYFYGTEDWVEYYFEQSVGEDLDYFESYVGHNYKLSYETQDFYKLSGRQLDTILDAVESSYPNFDISEISQVNIAEVRVTAKEGKSSIGISIEVTMTKENGKWKLLYID